MKLWNNEGEFRSALVKTLNRLPRIKARKRNTGRRGRVSFGERGEADVDVIIGPHGRYACIELKQPGGKRSAEQISWSLEVQNLGVAYLCTDSMWEAVSWIQRLASSEALRHKDVGCTG